MPRTTIPKSRTLPYKILREETKKIINRWGVKLFKKIEISHLILKHKLIDKRRFLSMKNKEYHRQKKREKVSIIFFMYEAS